MIFTPQELLKIGVPPKKIKLFIGVDFASEEAVLDSLKPKEEAYTKAVTDLWLNWIWNTFPNLPMSFLGELPIKMSRSELKRILDSKSLEVNGKFPTSKCEISDADFPITSFVWFPKSNKRKTTWL